MKWAELLREAKGKEEEEEEKQRFYIPSQDMLEGEKTLPCLSAPTALRPKLQHTFSIFRLLH